MSRLRWLVALLLAFVVVVFAGSAAARPGGGQSYRSSGGGSRSSSSSSSWGGSRSSSSTYYGGSTGYSSSSGSGSSSDDGSGVAVVILIVIIIVIIYYARKKKAAPERANVQVDTNVRAQALGKLQKIEPGFDEKAFEARATATMQQVNDAWQRGAMGPARRLISDGVYVRFRTQLELLKAQGLRNVMADARVVSATILDAETDALWDTVHVRMVGEARDADVPVGKSEEEAKKLAAGRDKNRYEEVWSFVRRRGHKAKDGKGALTGDCPNCGAPMPISDVVKCSHCNALVNSGEHDWVLAEITQPEEFSPYDSSSEPDGLAELRQKDPSVSRQELEDRASVLFWKWIEAQALGKREKLERFCLVAGKPEVAHVLYQQVAVGSAEVTQLYDEGGSDLCEVEIVWSAGTNGGEPVNRTYHLTMGRAESARSKRGLSSLDCPNCGGPLAESDAPKCSYCGEALVGGKHEWALASIDGDVTDGGGE